MIALSELIIIMDACYMPNNPSLPSHWKGENHQSPSSRDPRSSSASPPSCSSAQTEDQHPSFTAYNNLLNNNNNTLMDTTVMHVPNHYPYLDIYNNPSTTNTTPSNSTKLDYDHDNIKEASDTNDPLPHFVTLSSHLQYK